MMKSQTSVSFNKGTRTYFDDISYTDDEERIFKDLLMIKDSLSEKVEVIKIVLKKGEA